MAENPEYEDMEQPSSSTVSPINVIVLGMAGSGKTRTVQRMTAWLHQNRSPPYVINLDPAVLEVPYPVNVDIRDTVKYKEVMKQTAKQISSRKLLGLIHVYALLIRYVLFDTPGQIEVVTWSASGTILIETLASLYPTVILYVVDTAKCMNPITFMSSMLYACSISYKMKLPFILVFNKIDIIRADCAIEWMKDFEEFHEALKECSSYSADLAHSLSLALDDYYSVLKVYQGTMLIAILHDGYPIFRRYADAELASRCEQLEQLKLDIKETPST
ncbi:unnamed protein product [Soboliphyme baturini]|uniref:GPN-loop GTPase n=1 Tax=Soboliphyme baturini TaxID=241478 RepID=A0A183IUI1_9BILA|nr:unnamed protein product [Soboliphyme baturini]